MARCSSRRTGGHTEARWKPVIVLRPPGTLKADAEVRIEADLVLCDACRAYTTVEQFVTDEAWDTVTRIFAMTKQVLPDRAKTTLDWIDTAPKEPT